MKKIFVIIVTCTGMMFASCAKTYNCSCEASTNIIGQVKATRQAKAQQLCNNNCNGQGIITSK